MVGSPLRCPLFGAGELRAQPGAGLRGLELRFEGCGSLSTDPGGPSRGPGISAPGGSSRGPSLLQFSLGGEGGFARRCCGCLFQGRNYKAESLQRYCRCLIQRWSSMSLFNKANRDYICEDSCFSGAFPRSVLSLSCGLSARRLAVRCVAVWCVPENDSDEEAMRALNPV